jgi:hypothetical protein
VKGEFGKCGPCPVFARYTLAFALHLRKKHGKPQLVLNNAALKTSITPLFHILR